MNKKIFKKIRSVIIVLAVAVLTILVFYYTGSKNEFINKKIDSQQQNSEFKKVRISGQNGDIELKIEIADDPAERSRGLMNRNSMKDDEGMLFIFEKSDYVNFWMKNTLIPLDMIFIDQDHKIAHIASEVKPCPEGVLNCPLYPSELPVKYVLEINAGLSKKHGFRNGDLVQPE